MIRMTRYRHEIRFNGGFSENKRTYSFGRIRDIELYIGNGKASIVFWLSTRKKPEDFISFSVKAFRDAYRKVHQIMLFQYQKKLTVNKIEFIIGRTKRIYNGKDKHFPYLFSMIGDDIDLDPSWNKVVDPLLNTTKSKQDNDRRFSVAFSYLSGISRQFEIDRFTNLWTAMNAYYGYIEECYRDYLKNQYGAADTEVEKLRFKAETDQIRLACRLIAGKKLTAADESAWKEAEYELINTLTVIDSLPDFYDETYQALTDDTYHTKYERLEIAAGKLGIPLFLFLLLRCPYKTRCKYLHGEKTTTLLSAYNDVDILVLKAHNCFLQRYLNKAIPQMFEEDFWKEENQEIAEQLCIEIKDGKKGTYRRMIEELKNRKNSKSDA